MKTGHTYRDQLDRARRFLERAEDPNQRDIDHQDFIWAFFQNCWHLKEWIWHDDAVPADVRKTVKDAADTSPILRVCGDLCNGTKHLKLTSPKVGAGAEHKYTETVITPGSGAPSQVDTVIDMGDGTTSKGLEFAHKCLDEWEAILKRHGLNTARRS
jgi:hypothetical protein